MKKINLKSLSIENFKGIKNLSIDFQEKTNILGQNGTGKTSVFDAFTWLLFNKDSSNRADFNIKPLDKDNNPLSGVEVSVSAVLDVDGKEITLKKNLKELWTKPKGQADKVFTGNTTDYLVNDVPVKQSEYKKQIEEIVDESIFKMITNPYAFNTLPWKEQRKTILEISGDITALEIFEKNPELKPVEKYLSESDPEILKKQITRKKKDINDSIASIPTRIDEASKNIQDFDFEAIEKDLNQRKKHLEVIENRISDEGEKYKVFADKKEKLYEFKKRLMEVKLTSEIEAGKPKKELEKKVSDIQREIFDTKSEIESKQKRLKNYDSEIELYSSDISKIHNEIESLEKEIEELRTTWRTEKARVLDFSEGDYICPTCKREFPEEMKEEKRNEVEEHFRAEKERNLEKITNEGISKKNEKDKKTERMNKLAETFEETKQKKEATEKEISDLQERETILSEKYSEAKKELDGYVFEIPESQEEKAINLHIAELEKELKEAEGETMNDLKAEKTKLVKEIDELKAQFAYEEINKKTRERISELKAGERKLSKELANLEKLESLTDEFVRIRVSMLEEKINSKFETVDFKLFNTLINGGLEETCQTLINGVPYSDVNFAAKINSGIEIINVLCEYYGVQAPIFIDNRESVIKLSKTDSQVINLIVSEKYPELYILEEALI